MNHFHLPAHRRVSSASRYGNPAGGSGACEPGAASGAATPLPPHRALPARTSVERMGGGSVIGGHSSYRPISCPPKPGYTHAARAGTPGGGGGHSSAISPGPGMHYNDFRHDDNMSQQSFR